MHIQAGSSVQAYMPAQIPWWASLSTVQRDILHTQQYQSRSIAALPWEETRGGKKIKMFHCNKVILIWPGVILWWGFTPWYASRHFHFLTATSSRISSPALSVQLSSPPVVPGDWQLLTPPPCPATQPSCPPPHHGQRDTSRQPDTNHPCCKAPNITLSGQYVSALN